MGDAPHYGIIHKGANHVYNNIPGSAQVSRAQKLKSQQSKEVVLAIEEPAGNGRGGVGRRLCLTWVGGWLAATSIRRGFASM